MLDGLVNTTAQAELPEERRITGVAVAQVIDTLDQTGQGRVQLHLPWLPGYEPWARVAVLTAGRSQGTYFMPQQGDEVLVAFAHGDVREPYVIGCLWNSQDRSPAEAASDAMTKRIIRTPAGHEIVFDDEAQSITVTNSARQQITIGSSEVEVKAAGDKAKLRLDQQGKIELTSNTSIEIKAPKITLDGKTVTLKGSAKTSIDGGGLCEVKAKLVKIN